MNKFKKTMLDTIFILFMLAILPLIVLVCVLGFMYRFVTAEEL